MLSGQVLLKLPPLVTASDLIKTFQSLVWRQTSMAPFNHTCKCTLSDLFLIVYTTYQIPYLIFSPKLTEKLTVKCFLFFFVFLMMCFKSLLYINIWLLSNQHIFSKLCLLSARIECLGFNSCSLFSEWHRKFILCCALLMMLLVLLRMAMGELGHFTLSQDWWPMHCSPGIPVIGVEGENYWRACIPTTVM